jgi:hypothetical protein
MGTKTNEILRLKGLIQELAAEERQLLKLQEQFGNTSYVRSQTQAVSNLNKEIRITSLELAGVGNAGKSLSFSTILGDLNSITAIGQRAFGLLSLAITPVINAIKEFGTESFNAFNRSEVSLNRLKFGLTAIGETGSLDKLVEQSRELQNISIFSNESIQNSMSMLTSLKMNSGEIEKIIPSVLDLASAYTTATGDTDGLNTVTRLLSTTAGDELYKALDKVGVSFTGAQKKQLEMAAGSERVALVMSMVGDKFSGMSQTLSGSTLGGMQQLTNVWNDIQAAVGGVISEALGPVLDLLKELMPVIQESVTNLAKFAKEWVTTMLEAAGSKAEFGDLKTVLMTLIKEGFNKIIEVGRELMPVFKQYYEEIGKLIGNNKEFIDILKMVGTVVIDVGLEFFKFVGTISTAVLKYINFIADVKNTTIEMIKTIVDLFSKAVPSAWIDSIIDVVTKAKQMLQGLIDKVTGSGVLNYFFGGKDGERGGSGGKPDNLLADNLPENRDEKILAENGNKLRLEQGQKEEELMRMQLGYANDMWSNFQGMLQSTGLMKGQFGEIISFINSFISGISSGVSFFESLVGFIGSFIPGGGAVTAIAGQAGGMPGGGNMPQGLPRVSVPERTEIPFMGSAVSSNHVKYNVEMPEVRLKGSDLYLSWRRQKTIQDKRTQ